MHYNKLKNISTRIIITHIFILSRIFDIFFEYFNLYSEFSYKLRKKRVVKLLFTTRFIYLIKSFITSPAQIKPATDGTKATLPGIAFCVPSFITPVFIGSSFE